MRAVKGCAGASQWKRCAQVGWNRNRRTHRTRAHPWSCTATLRPCRGYEKLPQPLDGPWQLCEPSKGVQEHHSGRDAPRWAGMEIGAPTGLVHTPGASRQPFNAAEARERLNSHQRDPGSRQRVCRSITVVEMCPGSHEWSLVHPRDSFSFLELHSNA